MWDVVCVRAERVCTRYIALLGRYHSLSVALQYLGMDMRYLAESHISYRCCSRWYARYGTTAMYNDVYSGILYSVGSLCLDCMQYSIHTTISCLSYIYAISSM